LEGSLLIVKTIDLYNSHVLVHCSDGWDRTSQLVAISEVCLDPYYRTIEGFEVLVEKDWISFGHKFSHRCGLLAKDSANLNEVLTSTASKIFNTNGNKDSTTSNTISSTLNAVSNFTSAASKFLKMGAANITSQKDQAPQASSVDSVSKNSTLPRETSPIFTQFLDCIYQLWIQNPTQFEFNDDFLVQLNTHVYSSQFGTFLFNSEYERRVFRHDGKDLSQCTYSVWDWFNSNKEDYINPLYIPPTEDSPDIMKESQQAIAQYEDLISSESNHSLPSENQTHVKVIYPKTSERVIKYWSKLYNRTDDEMNGLEQTHGSSNNIVNDHNNYQRQSSITDQKSDYSNNLSHKSSSTSITNTPLDYSSLAATITDTSVVSAQISSSATDNYPYGRRSSVHSQRSSSQDSLLNLLNNNNKDKKGNNNGNFKDKSEEELDVLYGSPFQSLQSQSKLSNSNISNTSSYESSLPPAIINDNANDKIQNSISSPTTTDDATAVANSRLEQSSTWTDDPLASSSVSGSTSSIKPPEYYTQPDYAQIKNNTSISSIPQMATAESTFAHPLE